MSRYLVRYRGDGAGCSVALLVEDEQGAAHLFSGGQLQGGLRGQGAAERLVRLLERRITLSPLPEVAPYTLEGLCCLVGASGIEGASIAAEVSQVARS